MRINLRFVARCSIPVFFMLLAGCMTTLPDSALNLGEAPKPQVNDKKAILYVYRPHAIPILWSPSIDIDKTPYASLPNRGFTWFYVEPGEHEIHINWPFLSGGPSVRFPGKFEAGKTYAYEVTGSMSVGYNQITISGRAKEIALSDAMSLMQTCCKYAPSNQPETTAGK